jgi:hypothetical protein
MVTGYKKPRNGELDQLQQDYNASHGTARSPVERYIGIYKFRFDMAMGGYHGPLRHFVRLVKLGIVFTNDIIRICQNHFTEAEDEIINDTIRTVVHTNPLSEFLLINNSLSETMPEVLANPQTGEHVLRWDGMEKQKQWEGRNRTLQDPYSSKTRVSQFYRASSARNTTLLDGSSRPTRQDVPQRIRLKLTSSTNDTRRWSPQKWAISTPEGSELYLFGGTKHGSPQYNDLWIYNFTRSDFNNSRGGT